MYLNCHTFYSLKYGTISVNQWIDLAQQYGLLRLCITDINNTTAILEIVKAATEKNIKIIAGVEFRNKQGHLLYIGIAKNNEGYFELNQFLSQYLASGKELPSVAPIFNHVFVIYDYDRKKDVTLRDNERFGIRFKHLSKILFEKSIDQERMVLLQPVSFLSQEQYQLHLRLRAIEFNCLISQIKTEQIADEHSIFIPPQVLRNKLSEQSWLITKTEQMLDKCSFDFDFTTIKNKETFTDSKYNDQLELERLTYEGMLYRYGSNHEEAKRRIANELFVINDLGFSAYFLIAQDIIKYTISKGFYHVGRGSGANSIVAYCLRITDVCPIELDLYFERFLNHKRKSPPDLDIDFCWKDRDEVYDYLFKKYGYDHTALLGTITTFGNRSILRELGKVYGLPKKEIDGLISFLDKPQSISQQDTLTQQIFSIHHQLKDFPYQRSIHAGGILISEKPLYYYCALDLPPKGYPTTQFDMYTAEEAGFEKLDILSQRGIGHIKEAVTIIESNQQIKIDIHDINGFKTDPKIATQLKSADTIGAFYIESPAMRGLLTKLRCDNYITLVAASSIIRPGVAQSGMMKTYIERYHDPQKVDYLHPVMQAQLKETYGVMVYQEDVIKIGHHFGGLDLTESDVLRRLMSGKNRGKKHLPEIEAKYFANCKAKGYDDQLVQEVWRQIGSFAGFSFSKAHSASFAVESYQSLFLKTYYPLEFYTAVINNFGGFYQTWIYIHSVRKHGANIHLPCVNNSLHYTTIKGKDVYLGFIHIENLEKQNAVLIPHERKKNGMYLDLEDFVNRTHISLDQSLILIRLNAFAFTGKTKKQLLWEAHHILGMVKNMAHEDEPLLFQEPSETFVLPELNSHSLEDIYDEIQLMGYPITKTRFDLLRTAFRGDVKADTLLHHIGKQVKMVGDLVTTKKVYTTNGKIMFFGTWLDDQGNFFDTVHFPQSLIDYPFKGAGVYLILGKVVEEFGFTTLEIQKMAKLEIKPDPRSHN
jgi:error-prone DNA polymerase